MLQIQNISKKYKTGELLQTALDEVSLNLRDNEFVAVLGPSGSGKTTLLNIIGGLDRYDSGNLIINGISTKKYKDRDWDSYRNHTIGFVFQSYNLIPHQNILSNVELALTISGISKSERRKRAKEALRQVGLGDQIHKKPNQMSGGQMQRVAIARALVNDPDILLADEPTGALDSETSLQVMEMLKEVAKDRLVVMVTHNPELAEKYATRTIKLRDGKVTDDSDPYEIDASQLEQPKHANMGKSSMRLLTALSLSFNNLRTKKGRTILTSFSGSIGIIGIALILSISNGVNQYVADVQKSTMTSYPITISAQAIDVSSMMSTGRNLSRGEPTHELDAVYSDPHRIEMLSNMTTSISENNLTDFKKYLDNKDSEIHKYVGENGIKYSYDVKFNVFAYDTENTLVDTNGVVIKEENTNSSYSMMMNMSKMTGMMPSRENFSELLPGGNGNMISTAITDNYDLLYGSWPKAYDEVIVVLNDNNEISLTTLYELGLLSSSEYNKLMEKINAGEKVELNTDKWSYSDFCKQGFYIIPASDQYKKTDNGYINISNNAEELAKLTDNAQKLKITGIVRAADDASDTLISGTVGYTSALTDYIISHTRSSEIVMEQEKSKDINILNGLAFSPADDIAKAEDAKKYLSSLNVSEKAAFGASIVKSMHESNPNPETSDAMPPMSEQEMSAALDMYLQNPDTQVLLMIYDKYISTGTYDENMNTFGLISLEAPSSISIYSDSFENKDNISKCIENYNSTATDENQIKYTDYVGLLMSSVTTIVDVISYVLIAFVAVSLIVSSIMIGIITYISVIERTKEIGILRAIGASKHNISQVFNAETFIVGLGSGIIGVSLTLILLIPANAIIQSLTGLSTISASLPPVAAIILIVLSVILTLIGGLIPSKKAAKKDPVSALRTE